MDLLNLEDDVLYFDEPLQNEAQECLQQAAASYGKERAERLLLKAHFLEPEHPMVLVALYRYYYYQHRLKESLQVAVAMLHSLFLVPGRMSLQLWMNPPSFRLSLF